jgi:hypothetical protein
MQCAFRSVQAYSMHERRENPGQLSSSLQEPRPYTNQAPFTIYHFLFARTIRGIGILSNEPALNSTISKTIGFSYNLIIIFAEFSFVQFRIHHATQSARGHASSLLVVVLWYCGTELQCNSNSAELQDGLQEQEQNFNILDTNQNQNPLSCDSSIIQGHRPICPSESGT